MASDIIGGKLREARLALGLTLADISRETRISTRFLGAIESGDIDSLPAHLFARNFIRQYALTVALHPEPLLAELAEQLRHEAAGAVEEPEPPVVVSHRLQRKLQSALSSGLWLLLAAGAATGAYLHFKHSGATCSPGTPAAAAPPSVPAPPRFPPPTAPPYLGDYN